MACKCAERSALPPLHLHIRKEARGYHASTVGDYGATGVGFAFSTIEELTEWLLETYAQPKEAA